MSAWWMQIYSGRSSPDSTLPQWSMCALHWPSQSTATAPRPPPRSRIPEMGILPASAIELLESGANAHLVTVNADGSPQLSLVWPGVEGDEIVVAHLRFHQKLRNVGREPRVVLSVEGPGRNGLGLRDYLVIHGQARIVEGGAPDLLRRLAPRFLPAEAGFPPAGAPQGWVLRIRPERLGGSGPWSGA